MAKIKGLDYDGAINLEREADAENEQDPEEAFNKYAAALETFRSLRLFGECHRVAGKMGNPYLQERFADKLRDHQRPSEPLAEDGTYRLVIEIEHIPFTSVPISGSRANECLSTHRDMYLAGRVN